MTSPDVADVAARLTKAQREALTRNYPEGQPRALDRGDPSTTTLNCLRSFGLVDGHQWSRQRNFTTLGLAVRAHLQGSKS